MGLFKSFSRSHRNHRHSIKSILDKVHALPCLQDLKNLAGKKVLLRSDLNVPLVDGKIQDHYRIKKSIPTIQWLKDAGAEVKICSHLGRPSPEATSPGATNDFLIQPIRQELESLVPGITVMENLRLSKGEETCDQNFILELIKDQDIYINDAFGTCHRSHASIVGPPQYLPSAAGLLLEKEIQVLTKLLQKPGSPFVVIMGGAKVSDKLGLIDQLLEKADILAIGGAMAFTFLVAQGSEIDDPLVDEKRLPSISKLLASPLGKKIHLPEDLTALSPNGEVRQIGTNVPPGWLAKDIGPGTAAQYSEFAQSASSVFWNGPLGVFEDPRFLAGTKTIAQTLAESSAYSVVGGGDSAFAVRNLGLEDNMDHLSTGGGATLKFIEEGSLIGIEALTQSKHLKNLN